MGSVVSVPEAPKAETEMVTKEMKNKIKDDLEIWKKTPIKIGVIGQSGVGKSAFMNQFRGLNPKYDKFSKDSAGNNLWAEVGTTETTSEIKSYEFKENHLMKLYDLPGAGSINFPIDSYHEKIDIERYDAFIFLAKSRFFENDLKILDKIRKMKKQYYFARTHIDIDLQNYADDNPEHFIEKEYTKQVLEQEMTKIKEVSKEKLLRQGQDVDEVFLISKFSKFEVSVNRKFAVEVIPDNTRLKMSILENFSDVQKTAFIFSMGDTDCKAGVDIFH